MDTRSNIMYQRNTGFGHTTTSRPFLRRPSSYHGYGHRSSSHRALKGPRFNYHHQNYSRVHCADVFHPCYTFHDYNVSNFKDSKTVSNQRIHSKVHNGAKNTSKETFRSNLNEKSPNRKTKSSYRKNRDAKRIREFIERKTFSNLFPYSDVPNDEFIKCAKISNVHSCSKSPSDVLKVEGTYEQYPNIGIRTTQHLKGTIN